MLKDTICQTYLVKNNDDFNCVPLEQRGGKPKKPGVVKEGGEMEEICSTSRKLFKEDEDG